MISYSFFSFIQDYDPDLPPELAIAAGIQEASAENPNLTKPDGSLGAVTGQGRGAARPAILVCLTCLFENLDLFFTLHSVFVMYLLISFV